MISVFETEHFTFYGRDENDGAVNKWVKHLAFFDGDLTNVDTSADPRFKAVGNVRKQAKFMGLISSLTFPVSYPIITNAGLMLDGYVPLKYEVEKDYNESL